jgi:hypothetical protein
MNLNQFLDSLPTAADEQPKLAAERNAPHRRGLRTQAADGTLLGYDSMPLYEALPSAADTARAERSSTPICFDTPPTKGR